MALPEYDRVVFARSPLRLVVGQVRFPILLRFGESGFLAPFHDALRSEYPHAARENQVLLALSPQGIQPGPSGTLWRFQTRDRRLSVVVSEAAITLEAVRAGTDGPFGYQTIDDFLERFERILTIAQDTLEIAERTRLGLRYVNELRHPEAETLADWGKLLNPEFIGFAATDLLDGHVEQVLQEIQVKRSDGTLAIRHGLLTGTVIEPLPSAPPAGGRFYLVDLDYYDPTECPLEIASTLAQMRGFNDVVYRFFRWTLDDSLYRYLEPSHEP